MRGAGATWNLLLVAPRPPRVARWLPIRERTLRAVLPSARLQAHRKAPAGDPRGARHRNYSFSLRSRDLKAKEVQAKARATVSFQADGEDACHERVEKYVFQTSVDLARFLSLASRHPDDTRLDGFPDVENAHVRVREIRFARMRSFEKQGVVEEAGEIPPQAFPFAQEVLFALLAVGVSVRATL